MVENEKPDKGEQKPERPFKDFIEERDKMDRVPGKKEPHTVVDTLPPPAPQTPKSDED